MPEVRMIRRPEIVHLFKSGDGKTVITKCGETGKKNDVPTTPWTSESTCEECNP